MHSVIIFLQSERRGSMGLRLTALPASHARIPARMNRIPAKSIFAPGPLLVIPNCA